MTTKPNEEETPAVQAQKQTTPAQEPPKTEPTQEEKPDHFAGFISSENLEEEADQEATTDVTDDTPKESVEEGDTKVIAEGEEDKSSEEHPVEKRIGTLVRQRREAEREAAEWKAKALANEPKPQEEGTKEAPTEAEPSPDDYLGGELDRQFIIDTAKFHARQEFATLEAQKSVEKQQAENRAKLEAIDTNWDTQRAVGSTKHKDFEDKVIGGLDRGEFRLSDFAGVAIKASSIGADVAYFLAENPAEADRIYAMQPLDQVKEIGKLEARLDAPAATSAPAVSKAPPPPKHRASGGGGTTTIPPDTEDFASFAAKYGKPR